MATIQFHLIGARARRHYAILQGTRAAADAEADPLKKAEKLAVLRSLEASPVPWDEFSGRGVRLRLLDPAEKDRAWLFAAKEVGEGATEADLNLARKREVLCRSIVAVTEKTHLASEALMAGETRWIAVTQQALEGRDPTDKEHAFAQLFSAKDADVIANVWRRYHDATVDDVEAIVGGAVELADEG